MLIIPNLAKPYRARLQIPQTLTFLIRTLIYDGELASYDWRR